MKNELLQLIAFLIFIFGIIAIVFLTASKAVDFIKPIPFLGGVVVTGVILWLDALWIDKHFVDGEWI